MQIHRGRPLRYLSARHFSSNWRMRFFVAAHPREPRRREVAGRQSLNRPPAAAVMTATLSRTFLEVQIMFSVGSIIYGWDNQLGYAQALLEDLTDEQMVLRPQGRMNHPAWI